MILDCIIRFRHWGQGISLLLILGLLAGCAGPQPIRLDTTAPPPPLPQGPPMYQGTVINVQKFLPVRSDPSLSATEMGRLKPGDSLTIMEEMDEWFSVAAPDEKNPQLQGWVLQKYVARGDLIAPPEPPPPAAQPPSDDTKDLSGMKTATTLQGAALGALAGAAVGALVAVAAGKNVAAGAAIGAGAGLVTGLVAGVYVANQKEKYASDEAYLEACLAEARQYNEAAAKSNQDLDMQINLTEQNIDHLRNKVQDVSLRKQEAGKGLATIQQTGQTCDKSISLLEGEIRAQEKALSQVPRDSDTSGRSMALDNELVTMRQQLNEMKAKRDRLNDLNAQMSKMAV